MDVVRLLTRHGLSLRKAHETLERLAEGKIVPVELPSVSDRPALLRDLVGLGVHTFIRPEPKPVDIPRLRTKLGLTQREFALRYFVDVGTLRNWEQDRSPQDMQTRLYLSIIERHPEVVDEVIEELAASTSPC